MREKGVESYLRDQVHAFGGDCDKWVCPGKTGVPDRIIRFYPGVIAFIETKSKTGRLRARQKKVLAELEEQGFTVGVIRTKADAKLWVELFVSTKVRQALKALHGTDLLKPPRKHGILRGITVPSPYDLSATHQMLRKLK